MRFVLLFIAVLLISAPAMAADENVIKIIRDDGSVVVIEMGDDGSSTATVEKGEGISREAAPEAEPVDDASEPSYPRRQKPPEVSEEAPKAPVAPKKPKPAAKKVKPPKPAPAREIPQGAEITQDLATQIALDNAPPSTKFNAYRTALEGQQVFLVLFQTDEGPYEVVVDALDGKVLSRQHVRIEEVQTQPGHLPRPAPVPPGVVPVEEEGKQ